MKITALLLNIALLVATFCLPLQQSFAQTSADFPNSQTYFEKTTQRPKLKDYSRQVEALLAKMTLEEKVGADDAVGDRANYFGQRFKYSD